jgi:hypothetical protein
MQRCADDGACLPPQLRCVVGNLYEVLHAQPAPCPSVITAAAAVSITHDSICELRAQLPV